MYDKICVFSLMCCSLFGIETVSLKTLDLSGENIIGTNVGVRPVRKYGPRIEAEKVGDKLIVHNYGYGGSGITLSLGGSEEVVTILEAQNLESKTVAVLGAGVIGLTTAYDLLKLGFNVRIYSSDWSPNLTSNVGAGIWSPLSLPSDAPATAHQLNQRLLDCASDRFLKSTGENAEFDGVYLIDSYSFKVESAVEAIATKHNGEEVVVQFDNGVVKKGTRINEIAIDGKLFVEGLFSKVKDLGAQLHQQHFKTLDDILALDESIIINCTSLGSKELFNDQDMTPVRGQIVYFKPQEGVDYLMYHNVPGSDTAWVSIFPRSDRIVLGGVKEKGEEELIVNTETISNILENARKVLTGEF